MQASVSEPTKAPVDVASPSSASIISLVIPSLVSAGPKEAAMYVYGPKLEGEFIITLLPWLIYTTSVFDLPPKILVQVSPLSDDFQSPFPRASAPV